jgi:drug/metabolite transporter (DMT)-like permease
MKTMSKLSLTALIFCLSGFFLLVFQAISNIMGQSGDWNNLSLAGVLDPRHYSWVENISVAGFQTAAQFLLTIPLFALLLGCGILMFVISGFRIK